MYDPTLIEEMPARPRRPFRDAVPISLTVAALAVASLAIGLVLFPPAESVPPAQGHSMTNVRNGTTSKYLPIYVIRDSGIRNSVPLGSTIWGVSHAAIQSGTCVRINGGAAICSSSGWKTVPLAVGSYVIVRTK